MRCKKTLTWDLISSLTELFSLPNYALVMWVPQVWVVYIRKVRKLLMGNQKNQAKMSGGTKIKMRELHQDWLDGTTGFISYDACTDECIIYKEICIHTSIFKSVCVCVCVCMCVLKTERQEILDFICGLKI
jgi:hypothetical protein